MDFDDSDETPESKSKESADNAKDPSGKKAAAKNDVRSKKIKPRPANDDQQSVGHLLHSLQQPPSSAPYVFASILSLLWVAIGGGLFFMGFGGEQIAEGWSSLPRRFPRQPLLLWPGFSCPSSFSS